MTKQILIAITVLALNLFAANAWAQTAASADEMLEAAEQAYADAEDAPEAERYARLEDVRRMLDEIVDAHPASGPAVKILLGGDVGEIDLDELDRYLAENRPATPPAAQAMFDSAVALYAKTEGAEGDRLYRLMRSIRALLDRIADEHPSSDLAVEILLAEQVGPIDVARVDRVLAEAAGPDAAPAVSARPNPDEGRETSRRPPPDAAYQPPTRPREARRAERALAMNLRQRSEVQRRLALIGFYSRRIDGVFGDGTRSAIAEWQFRAGFPETGYLDRRQLLILMDDTEEVYQDWLRREPRSGRRGRYVGPDGCLREPDGRIVGHQSLGCDTRGLGQALGL